MANAPKATAQVILLASEECRNRNMILSKLLPCAAEVECAAAVSRPISGMS